MPKLKKTFFISFISVLLMNGCATSPTRPVGNTTSLVGLKQMAYTTTNTSINGQSRIRAQAIKETALSTGAQSGLAYRAKAINHQLIKQAPELERIYNFNALVLENNVLPPVLLEGRHILKLSSPQSIRLADRTYKISKQARFITTPPNWRQYLWLDYQIPPRPNDSLLPKTSEERQVWQHFVAIGWKNGVTQAEIIFADNLARLKQDFVGMILYRKLLAQNIVSPPYVSHTDLGVTGNQNEVHIDDKVLRITALPALRSDARTWHAAVSKEKDLLKNYRRIEKLATQTKIEITDNAWQPVIPHTQ